MIRNKKGMDMETLVIVLIASVVAIILLGVGDALVGIIKGGGDIEVCRLSVLAQSATNVAGKTPVSLNCPRREVVFFKDKVTINGKKEKKYAFKTMNDEAVNKIMAEELRLCWYKMGEGRVDVFRSNIATWSNTCVICSEVSFGQSRVSQKTGSLMEYLKNTKIPGTETMYFDYLIKPQTYNYYLPYLGILPYSHLALGGKSTTSLILNDFHDIPGGDTKEPNAQQLSPSLFSSAITQAEMRDKAEKTFDTSKPYTIYFLGFKPGVAWQGLGEYKPTYYIGLGDFQKVSNECSIIVN